MTQSPPPRSYQHSEHPSLGPNSIPIPTNASEYSLLAKLKKRAWGPAAPFSTIIKKAGKAISSNRWQWSLSENRKVDNMMIARASNICLPSILYHSQPRYRKQIQQQTFKTCSSILRRRESADIRHFKNAKTSRFFETYASRTENRQTRPTTFHKWWSINVGCTTSVYVHCIRWYCFANLSFWKQT